MANKKLDKKVVIKLDENKLVFIPTKWTTLKEVKEILRKEA